MEYSNNDYKHHIEFIMNRLMSYDEYSKKELVSQTAVENWAREGIVDVVIIGKNKKTNSTGRKFVILKDGETKEKKFIRRAKREKRRSSKGISDKA